MNYNVLNDYLVKIPNNHPYNKPKLDKVQVILSNNNLSQNPKLLVPLLNTSISITGQYPSLIKAKKSVASFKVRKGTPIGLLTTMVPNKGFGINSTSLDNFWKLWNIYYLPKFFSKSTIQNLAFSPKCPTKSTLTIGVSHMSAFTYLTPLADENVPTISKNPAVANTGGYVQFTIDFKLPEIYASKKNNLFAHKYFYSILRIPSTS